jgi:hypothetical protein
MTCHLFLKSTGRSRSWAGGLAILCALALVVGCYGSFPLTKAVYRINGDVTDQSLVHSIVMWIFVLVPVYSAAMIVDAVVFNLVEFWTGDSITASSGTLDSGVTYAFGPAENGRDAVLTLTDGGRTVARLTFVRISDQEIHVRNGDGERVGTVRRRADGGLVLADVSGEHVRDLSAGDVATLRAARDAVGSQ